MAKALGIGGIFFKTEDPAGLAAWYREWLSFPGSDGDYVPFPPTTIPEGGYTLWSPFAKDSDYFGNPAQPFMINIMVDDLDEALKQVAEGGAEVIPKTENYDYGSFGWFVDSAGNRVELWQAPAEPDTNA
jgi:predicted enzyme related to lactoylglutathione lyase